MAQKWCWIWRVSCSGFLFESCGSLVVCSFPPTLARVYTAHIPFHFKLLSVHTWRQSHCLLLIYSTGNKPVSKCGRSVYQCLIWIHLCNSLSIQEGRGWGLGVNLYQWIVTGAPYGFPFNTKLVLGRVPIITAAFGNLLPHWFVLPILFLCQQCLILEGLWSHLPRMLIGYSVFNTTNDHWWFARGYGGFMSQQQACSYSAISLLK